MQNYKLPYFKEINPVQLEESYDSKTIFNGEEIRLDLNFKNKEINIALLDSLKNILENIKNHDTLNRWYIDIDYKENDYVKEFIELHFTELAEEMKTIIDFEDKTISKEKQFLKKMKLVRIGFYPDKKYDSIHFAVFDYMIDPNISDQIICIGLDEKGDLLNVSWES